MTITVARLQARVKALEWVLIQTGRWTEDSEVDLIRLSSDPMDRVIADEIMKTVDKLERVGATV